MTEDKYITEFINIDNACYDIINHYSRSSISSLIVQLMATICQIKYQDKSLAQIGADYIFGEEYANTINDIRNARNNICHHPEEFKSDVEFKEDVTNKLCNGDVYNAYSKWCNKELLQQALDKILSERFCEEENVDDLY